MTPDPLEIGKFLILLSAIAGMYVKLQSALRQSVGKGESREISNNPLNVQETSRPATLHDVERVERRVAVMETDMKEMKRAAEQSRERLRTDISEMRDRMDDKLTTVSEELREIGRAVGRLEGN